MEFSPHLRAFAWLASGLLIGVVATGLAARHVLDGFFPSWDQQNLTQELAQNSVDLLVLQNLRDGKTSEAIEARGARRDPRGASDPRAPEAVSSHSPTLSIPNLISSPQPIVEPNKSHFELLNRIKTERRRMFALKEQRYAISK